MDENNLPPGWVNQIASLIEAVIDKRLMNVGIIPQQNLQKSQPLYHQNSKGKEKVFIPLDKTLSTFHLPTKNRKKVLGKNIIMPQMRNLMDDVPLIEVRSEEEPRGLITPSEEIGAKQDLTMKKQEDLIQAQ